MRRRLALALSLAAAAGLARPVLASTQAHGAGIAPRRLRLRHLATGLAFSGIYHDGRAPDAAAMRDLSQLLADTGSGAVRAFDVRTLDMLWELGERERVTDFTVLSGYRTPASNALAEGAPDSQHMKAAAIDVTIPAARLAGFAAAARALGRGGVGIYRARGFVHLDSGPIRSWGDGAAGAVRAQDPLRRMAEAWAATRTPGRR